MGKSLEAGAKDAARPGIKRVWRTAESAGIIIRSIPAGSRGKFIVCVALGCLIPLGDMASAYAIYLLVMGMQGESAAVRSALPWGDHVIGSLVLFAALLLVRQGLELASIYRTRHFTQMCYRIFVLQLFERYLSASWLPFTSETKATRMKHLTSTALNASYTFQVVFDFLGAFFLLALLGASAALLTPLLFASLLLAMLVFVALSQRWVGRRVKAAREQHEAFERNVYNRLQESLGLFREIRMFRMQSWIVKQAGIGVERLSKAKTDLSVYTHIPRLMLEACFILVLCVSVGSVMAFDGERTQTLLAGMASLAVVARRIVPAMALLLSASAELEGSRIVMASLRKELDQPSAPLSYVRHATLPAGILLEMRQVTFAYPGRQPTLHNVSLVIRAGDRLAVTGETGAGKSTLMMIGAGYLPPAAGEVAAAKTLSWTTGEVAYVAQETMLFSGSVLDNIRFGAAPVEQLLQEVVRLVGLNEVVRQLPEGLETHIGDNGIFLSGGQRQRLGIARALYRRPRLLFLDEATSALDEATEREVMENIDRRIGSDGAVVFITHRQEASRRYATRVLQLPAKKGVR